MPELPEAEVCRRQLDRWSGGRTVTAVRAPTPDSVRAVRSTSSAQGLAGGAEALAEHLVGRRADGTCRHGKRIGWTFGDHALLVHLGMTGRWVRRDPDDPPRHGRVGLGFGDVWLWFDDARRFGCVVPVDTADLDATLRDGLGPDPLIDGLDGARLARALRGRRPVKVALCDQARLAGIGNIQAAEACFRAGLDPRTPSGALDPATRDRLAAAVVAQLEHTIARTDGEEVAYVTQGGANPFAVYGREGEACGRCGGRIQRFRQAGRSTFWCAGCQRAPGDPPTSA